MDSCNPVRSILHCRFLAVSAAVPLLRPATLQRHTHPSRGFWVRSGFWEFGDVQDSGTLSTWHSWSYMSYTCPSPDTGRAFSARATALAAVSTVTCGIRLASCPPLEHKNGEIEARLTLTCFRLPATLVTSFSSKTSDVSRGRLCFFDAIQTLFALYIISRQFHIFALAAVGLMPSPDAAFPFQACAANTSI